MNPDTHPDSILNHKITKSVYTYPDHLVKNIKHIKQGCTILHHNIRSLPKHYDELIDFLTYLNTNIDCIVLSETFLNDINKDQFPLPGYKAYHLVRSKKKGGGVSIFIKETSFKDSKLYSSALNENLEALMISLSTTKFDLKVIGVYRPPNSSRVEFINNLKIILEQESNLTKLVITGDFNIDLLCKNSANGAEQLSNLMNSNGLVNCITLPTRPNTDDYRLPTLIDHIWTNLDYKTEAHIIPTDITDHYPCVAIFYLPPTKTELVTIKYRRNDENCKRIFVEKLNTSNFDFIFDDSINLNDKFHRFNSTIFEIGRAHV